MSDGGLVAFRGPLDRLLRAVSGPAQHLPRGGDADGDVEHPTDQRADPGQRPPLVFVPSGRGRPLVQFLDQLAYLRLGQDPVGTWCSFGGQGRLTAGLPGPPPRVRRFGGDLQLGGDLWRALTGREHPGCLPAYLLAAGTLLRADPAAVPVSHALTRHET